MVWVNDFDIDRVLLEVHKVLNIFEDSLDKAIIVGVVVVLRSRNPRHLLSGFACVVDLKVNSAMTLDKDAYHRKFDNTMLGQQSFHKRCMLLTHVRMVFIFAYAGLAVGANCPLE